MKRRIISLLMALVMTLSLVPTTVWAAGIDMGGGIVSGGQGENTSGGVYDDGTGSSGTGGGVYSGVGANSGAVAEVTDYNKKTTAYSTIEEAFKAFEHEGTVKLLQDVTLNDTNDYGIILSGSMVGSFDNAISGDLTLELNGKTISQKTGITSWNNVKSVFYVGFGCTLTIQDSSETGGGKILQPNGGIAVTCNEGGTVIVKSGTIEQTGVNSDINNNCAIAGLSGTVTIEGGEFSGSQMGVGILSGCHLNVSPVTGAPTFHGGTYGLQIYSGGSASLSGGTYTGGSGGIFRQDGGKVTDLLDSGYHYEDGDGKVITPDGNSVPSGTKVVKTEGLVEYIDADGNAASKIGCIPLTAEGFTGIGANSNVWFVADHDITTSEGNFAVTGTVNLILCDGVTVALDNESITLCGYTNQPATLNIFAQSGGTGKLVVTATADSTYAGICNISGENDSAALNVYGGTVEATGALKEGVSIDVCSAGIGTAGQNESNNTLTVNICRGTVIAKAGGAGAQAIGSGTNAKGTVTVTIADGMKCVKTEDPSTECSYGNTEGTSVTITRCDHPKVNYTGTETDAAGHTGTCAFCRATVTGNHTFGEWTPVDGTNYHQRSCTAGCGYTVKGEHVWRGEANADGLTHNVRCYDCGEQGDTDVPHDFSDHMNRTVDGEPWWYYRCKDCLATLVAVYGKDKYTILQKAVDAAAEAENGTVELQDYLNENVTITKGNVTIDLNDCRWGKGDSNGTVLTVQGGSVTLENGIMHDSPACAPLVIEGGEVTLKSMDIRGVSNTVRTMPAVEVTSADAKLNLTIGVTLVNGMEVPAGKCLADYLPEGAAFAECDVNGKEITAKSTFVSDVYTTNKSTSDMAVVAHSHNGSPCACGYTCGHSAGMDSNTGKCAKCGTFLAEASVTAESATVYYDSFAGAVNAAKEQDGSTVKLLKNATLPSYDEDKANSNIYIEKGTFTIDWNGYTLTGGTWYGLLVITDGWGTRADVTLMDSNGNAGGARNHGGAAIGVYASGNVTIQSGIYSPQVLKDERASRKVTISGGVFENPESSGIRGALYYAGGKLKDMLASGYTFAYEDNTLLDVYNTNMSEGRRTVHVVAHAKHTFGENDRCDCGLVCAHAAIDADRTCTTCGKTMVVKVVKSGGETRYYRDLQTALNNAGVGTVTLLTDANTAGAFSITTALTLDLNGYNIGGTVTVGAKATIKDSGTDKGKIGQLNVVSASLTLGDLLEENYGFKTANGWADETAKTAGGISVMQVPFMRAALMASKTTKVYGEAGVKLTGDYTLNYSVTTYGDWYKIADDGTATALEETSCLRYVLPADLAVGQHTYRLTFRSADGYQTSREVTVTVTPAALTEDSVTLAEDSFTYDGSAKTPEVTVVLRDQTLVKDRDYTVAYANNTDAGTATVTVTGKDNYAGTVTKTYRITAKTITGMTLTVEGNAVYNGSAQTPDVTVRDGEKTLVKDTDYTVVSYAGNINAGEAAVTVAGKGNYQGQLKETFTIAKANAGTVGDGSLTITNDWAKVYTVQLPALPALNEPCRYGTIRYRVENVELGSYYDAGAARQASVSDSGVLTLPIQAVSSDQTGSVGTVTVKVSSDNYEEITIKVAVNAVNKAVPTGEPTLSRTTLRYGETLSAITLSGAMKVGETEIPGRFSWEEPNMLPNTAQYTAAWIFTPDDQEHYAVVTGKAELRVTNLPQKTHQVGGQVQYEAEDGQTGAPVANATVTIREGNKIHYRGMTDAEGKFTIRNVENGIYNVVVEVQDGLMRKTVTAKLILNSGSSDTIDVGTLKIPVEPVNSKLKQEDNVPDTVVGGLDDLAKEKYGEKPDDGNGVEVTMEVKAPEESKEQKDVEQEIRKKAPDKELEFIDIDLLLKTILKEQTPEGEAPSDPAELITDTGDTVLEIIISYDTSRKGITVLRHHVENGKDEVTQFDPKNPGKDGTFYIDYENHCIHIFTSKFSTYAIGYEPPVQEPEKPDVKPPQADSKGRGETIRRYPGKTDAAADNGKTVKSSDTGDAGMALYAALAIASLGGMSLLRGKRKRED